MDDLSRLAYTEVLPDEQASTAAAFWRRAVIWFASHGVTVERAVEWAYVRAYSSETARVAALRRWLHLYNHHRTHTALGGLPPASRVTNLSGQYP